MVAQRYELVGTQFVMALIYIYSKKGVDETISIFGFPVKMQYLPFAMLVIHVLSGANVVPDIIGILAGHVYHFVKNVCPEKYGLDLLRTPGFLYDHEKPAG